MAESRDRLVRSVDIAALFARRRHAGILLDEPNLFGSPIRPQQTPATTVFQTPAEMGTTTATPSIGSFRGRNNENGARRGRGRGRSGVLPSWYPRTPLRDITVIARAVERRRARLSEREGQGGETPLPEAITSPDPSVSEHVATAKSEAPSSSRSALKSKPDPHSVGKVPQILLGFVNQNTSDSDCLTPQKKLLNSIDSVEKAVMEELQKLKRTPIAKKAEREKRVRTLMSMR